MLSFFRFSSLTPGASRRAVSHTHSLDRWKHTHEFASVDSGNERRTAIVVALTAAMMAVEVAAGLVYGSMALLADGWHMGTHVAALGISVFAYRYARSHSADPRFTFGTGKVGVLGGFSSAIALAVVAMMMAAESFMRFFASVEIRFGEAITVAVAGLLVNLASAAVLGGAHGHRHDHHHHDHHHHDHNLRAAYMHVIADAFTSVLAIAALIIASAIGQSWPDPLMGLVGSGMIAWWSFGLLRDTGRILLDADVDTGMLDSIRSSIESGCDDRISDLHVWKVGSGAYAAIVSVVSSDPKPPDYYCSLLSHVHGLSHTSIEVHLCSPEGSCTKPGEDGPVSRVRA
jgi:cation diffusion facilitator family transporter